MPKLVYRKLVFLFFAFLFLISIHYTLYPIPFAHAAIREIPDCETLTQTPVTANVEPHETYLNIVSKAIIYPGVNQEIKDNPQNTKTVCAGISNSWLQEFFSNFTCSIASLVGLNDFCPQALSLGQNTVVFDSKTSTFKDANIYPNLVYEEQPSNTNVIQDTDPKIEVGDQIVSDVADRAGWKNGYYVVGFPDQVYLENNPNPIQLLDKLDENASLTQGKKFESERIGQLCPSSDLYVSGTFPPGFTPKALEECGEFVPQVSASSINQSLGDYTVNVYLVQGPNTAAENTPELSEKATKVMETAQNFYSEQTGKTFKLGKIEFVNAPISMEDINYKNEGSAEFLRKLIFGDNLWPANQISVIIVNGNITNALGFAQGFVKGEGIYRKENDNKPGIITDSGAVVTDDYIYNYLKKCDTVGDYNCTQAMYTVAHELAHAFGLPHYTTECNLLYISAGCFIPKFTDIAKESLKNSPFLN